jgi:hypothetical protein
VRRNRISLIFVVLVLAVAVNTSVQADTSADFTADGVVDFFDFAKFTSAWQTTLGHPDFNEIYDLDNDNNVDINDLDLFAGGDIIFVYASVIDINGTVVPDASQEVTFNISGPAYLASPPIVNSEAGIATALLRTTTQPGEITITATVPGIDAVTGIITSKITVGNLKFRIRPLLPRVANE